MLKICYVSVDIVKNIATFSFPNINNNMIKHLLTVQSYTFTTWNNTSEMVNYLEVVNNNNVNTTIIKVKDGVGFVPILVKHLNGLGFMLLNYDKTSFNLYKNCHEVKFPAIKFKLRNYQYDCILKWDRDKLGVIKSPTGSGKSVMGCYAIKKSGFKTLILVHTVDLINMWKDSLIKAFGNNFENKIGIFGSGKSLDKALSINNNIVIGTYQSATKESNLNKIKNAGFGLILNDECHHVPADTFKTVLNGLMIPYKLGLSATPRRLDGREGDIYALVDSIKASVSIHELIKNKFVVKPEFYNISWIDSNIVQKVANSNKNGLQKSLMLKKMSSAAHIKLTKLIKLIKTFENNNETFLIFADFVFATDVIEQIITNQITKYNNNFKVIAVAKEMKSDERSNIFKQVGKKYQGLIFAKLGSEGIDISAVDNIVIMNPSKSPTTFAQRTGRAMRIAPGKTKCKIFTFVLQGSLEEKWAEYSFDEYRNDGFVQKKCIIR